MVVPKKVTVVYGPATAPWDMFVDAARWDLRNRASSTPLSFPHEYSTVLAYFSRIILDIDSMRELWRDGKQTALLPLLRRFSGRQASDTWDKVYALLGLVRNGTSIAPDYSLSVPAVFQTTVLDVINHTKSLNVLAGDLGRKDRQDLPSWVPDWSAAYDDLDRRRAENTGDYRATDESLVYVQDETHAEFGGICRHLRITRNQLYAKPKPITRGDYVKRFNDILGTSDWVASLHPRAVGDLELKEGQYLRAIEKDYAARSIAVRLQNRGSGVISLAGLHVDRIAIVGATALSDDVLLSSIRSWILLLEAYFHGKKSISELGDAFRRMICADTVRTRSDKNGFTSRRVSSHDHGQIATWILQGFDSHTKDYPEAADFFRWKRWENLFQDLGDLSSYMSPQPISPSIDAAIRSATVRRTLFITDKGYIGLGPTKLRVGDHLGILLGGQSSFILREAGTRALHKLPSQPRLGQIRRRCFSMRGDCYTHGLMDGEAMCEWRKLADKPKNDIILRDLLDQYLLCDQNWNLHRAQPLEPSTWETHAAHQVLELVQETRNWNKRRRDADLPILRDDLKRMLQVTETEEEERAYDDLFRLGHEIQREEDTSFEIELRRAATVILKLSELETSLTDVEHPMDLIRERIDQQDVNIAQRGRVYLV